MNRDSPRLFFSYGRPDAAFVLGLAQDLRDAGVALWIDQLDISPGDHWDRSVEVALQTSNSVLLVLSPFSVSSTNVMDEVSYALNKGKRIVPVLLRSCEIPLRLHRLQYIDFTIDYARALEQLLQALLALDRDGVTLAHPVKTAKSRATTDRALPAQKRADARTPELPSLRAGDSLIPERVKDRARTANIGAESAGLGARSGSGAREQSIPPKRAVSADAANKVESGITSRSTQRPQSYDPTTKSKAPEIWSRRLPLAVGAVTALIAAVYINVQRTPPKESAGVEHLAEPPAFDPSIAPPPPTKPPAVTSSETQRFTVTQCGSVFDTQTKLEWYVGPDQTMVWDEAKAWIGALNQCDGRWEMPTISQLSKLYDYRMTAGTGFLQNGKYFPAHIDPVFEGIGAGAWVWSREAKDAKIARSFNFNQGMAVEYEKDSKTYTTRVFAVRSSTNARLK